MKSNDLAQVRSTLSKAALNCGPIRPLPQEYRGPVLGLIFLAYAEHRFVQIQPELEAKATAAARHAESSLDRGGTSIA